MRFKQFKIIKYRSISTPIVIEVSRNTLIPIIGENECGKTTILQAILAFDCFSDNLIAKKHLTNVKNRYNPGDQSPAEVSATILIDKQDYLEVIGQFHQKTPIPNIYNKTIRKKTIELTITRCFNGKTFYKIEDDMIKNESMEIQDELAKDIIRYLPHIVYFDDFSDSIPNVINIKNDSQDNWQKTMDVLLKSVNPDYSTTKLVDKDENDILSIQSDVSDKLTKTITGKWNQWKDIITEENKDKLSINFLYQKSDNSIKLKVVEKVNDNEKRSFDIAERSKGFVWFFNYVIKSEFNPKADLSQSTGVMFLLDEPGAYLHVSMQEKLCEKLSELSKKSTVIYCTHSHNLLKPEYIESANIHVCHKEKSGNILMQNISDYAINNKVSKNRKALAFEPIYHVLGVSDVLTKGAKNNILLTEGITDFYTFQMFKDHKIDISFLPSTNANHLQYNVPTFLACEKKFMCLYDYDKENGEGNKEWKKLKELFGEDIDNISFRTNDINKLISKTEDLYDENECKKIQKDFFYYNENQIVETKKLISRIFFSPDRSEIIKEMPKTKSSIMSFLKEIENKFKKFYKN